MIFQLLIHQPYKLYNSILIHFSYDDNNNNKFCNVLNLFIVSELTKINIVSYLVQSAIRVGLIDTDVREKV